MNIATPPDFGKIRIEQRESSESRIEQLEEKIRLISRHLQLIIDYQRDIYKFLQYPVFPKLKLYPRATIENDTEGDVYYDSDDDKLEVKTETAFEDCN